MEKSFVKDSRVFVYTFERKPVKNINLRVKSDGSIHVSAPKRVSEKNVHDFIMSKTDFIINALERLALNKNQVQAFKAFFEGDILHILGREYTVRVIKSPKNRINLDDLNINFFVTDTENKPLRTKMFDLFIRDIAEKEVTDICGRIYPLFSHKLKVFPEIKFRKMKTKWGICRPIKYVLTFNTLLAHAERECIEYVVFHEFCHFIHPNHSADFYSTLEGYFPRCQTCKEMLKNYNAYLRY